MCCIDLPLNRMMLKSDITLANRVRCLPGVHPLYAPTRQSAATTVATTVGPELTVLGWLPQPHFSARRRSRQWHPAVGTSERLFRNWHTLEQEAADAVESLNVPRSSDGSFQAQRGPSHTPFYFVDKPPHAPPPVHVGPATTNPSVNTVNTFLIFPTAHYYYVERICVGRLSRFSHLHNWIVAA